MVASYIKLSIAAALPVALSAILYSFRNIFSKSKRSYIISQIIIGLLFGVLAIVGTEWGIPLEGAQVNCRDAAPLCAGLFFGAPAGIIAGVIGGVERWMAIAWGVGSYTRLACSLSTIIAGIYAACLRKFMFDDRRPGWLISLACGVVMEVFHLTMVFVTNFDTASKAAQVVKVCTVPMVTANGLSVMFASVVLAIIAKERITLIPENNKISDIIQKWLLITVIGAFLVTTTYMYFLQTGVADANTKSLLQNGINDLKADIEEASDEYLLDVASDISDQIDKRDLDDLVDIYKVSEINIVDNKGIIVRTTYPDYLGYDMRSGEQSAEFMCLLKDQSSYVSAFGPISYDASISRKYAGVRTESGFVQVGLDAKQFQKKVDKAIANAAKNRRIGDEGFLFILDYQAEVVSSIEGYEKYNVAHSPVYKAMKANDLDTVFSSKIFTIEYYCMASECEGYTLLAAYPVSEANSTVEMALYTNSFLEVLVFAILFGLIYILIKNVVVNQIKKVNTSLGEITKGNLGVTVDVRSSEEFASLSDDINSTVDTLKNYIDEAAARIDKELEFAKNIQYSALPNIFPAFPKRKEFDIYARMDTAKEVGGDFYDFYLNHHEIFNFLIADVSGKGIPAALFMMRAKTQLKSLTESDLEIDEVFNRGNAGLCEGNDANMFVTAWQGKMNLNTGLVEYANAGHNPPLVKHAGGQFEYLSSRPGFILAGMEGMKYRKQELHLDPGDIIYLYTDGVTEATDANEELYGEERLKNILNSREFKDMKDLCDCVKEDVDSFVGDAPQFDDITMLAFRFNGEPKKPTIHYDIAKIEDIPAVTAFVESELEKMDCPMKATMQIDIAIDELYSNIAKYSYGKNGGPATVTVEEIDDPHGVKITFIDEGIPYNPLKKPDPDTDLALEDRGIGGLGIFMVKNQMDDMVYAYSNDRNILTIIKNF